MLHPIIPQTVFADDPITITHPPWPCATCIMKKKEFTFPLSASQMPPLDLKPLGQNRKIVLGQNELIFRTFVTTMLTSACLYMKSTDIRSATGWWFMPMFILALKGWHERDMQRHAGLPLTPTHSQLPSEPRLCFYQTRSAWSVDQGSNKNHSPAYNFVPTVTKFCVMWEGLSLPHDTKFGNCRCKIVDSRAFPSWSLIHGLRWSGLIKAEPGDAVLLQCTWSSLAQLMVCVV